MLNSPIIQKKIKYSTRAPSGRYHTRLKKIISISMSFAFNSSEYCLKAKEKREEEDVKNTLLFTEQVAENKNQC